MISGVVGRCEAPRCLLAIIGDDWLRTTYETITRRIDDPNDFVHIEIRQHSIRTFLLSRVVVEGGRWRGMRPSES